jgi:hypothetical protein
MCINKTDEAQTKTQPGARDKKNTKQTCSTCKQQHKKPTAADKNTLQNSLYYRNTLSCTNTMKEKWGQYHK